ncbi:MAG: hypothetical protein WA584_05580 [Pyrinomonadaceae bacterium]
MKKCPVCNRTYADETLSFCLEDGSLLSASFNLYEEQKTVVGPNSMELPPTQFYSPPKAEHIEIPTIVSSKNVNPVYQRPPEMQNIQNPNSPAKSLGFAVGKAHRKFSLNVLLFILFILVLATIYTLSTIPLVIALFVALVYLALLVREKLK